MSTGNTGNTKAIFQKPHIIFNDTINTLNDYLKTDKLKFHQFYNTDMTPSEQAFYSYLAQFDHYDSINWDKKILNKTYYDIETRFDPKKAPDPINVTFPITSIALYNNILNLARVYFLKDKSSKAHKDLSNEKLKMEIEKIYNEKIKENPAYEVQDLKIEVIIFNDEKDLISQYFEDLKNLDTLFLIGFNSSLFDDPYTINRLYKLVGNNAEHIITDFELKKFGSYTYEWPEIILVDMLKLYKPVDAGGSGMGKSLPKYKLDVIAEVELDINKLDLTGNFNEVYLNNPYEFAAYNLFDVILTYKLDLKLQFMEQIYSIAKNNHASVRASAMGRSFIFNYKNSYHYYAEENQLIRNNKFNKEIFYNPFED